MDDLYIRKVLDGDHDAFRYFIRQYQHMAFSIAISVVKNEFTAEEVVQDAFMKAFHHLAGFQRTAKFSTWFYRIVTNEALMRLKKLQKERLDFQPGFEEEVPDNGPEVVLADEEQQALVQEALKLLPPKESLVLRLFYLEEERIKTICDITGWSEANVKVLLHRARKTMAVTLKRLMAHQH